MSRWRIAYVRASRRTRARLATLHVCVFDLCARAAATCAAAYAGGSGRAGECRCNHPHAAHGIANSTISLSVLLVFVGSLFLVGGWVRRILRNSVEVHRKEGDKLHLAGKPRITNKCRSSATSP